MITHTLIKFSLLDSFKKTYPIYIPLLLIVLLFSSSTITFGYPIQDLGLWDITLLVGVCGLTTCFKERFHIFIQNGFSRKTLFINFMISFVIIAGCMSLVSCLLSFMDMRGILRYTSLFANLYGTKNTLFLLNFVWFTTLSIALLSTVFLLKILYYRSNYLMRSLLIAIPVIIITRLFIINILFSNTMWVNSSFILEILSTLHPMFALMIFLGIAVVMSIGSFIALHKLDVMKS